MCQQENKSNTSLSETHVGHVSVRFSILAQLVGVV